MMEHQAYKTLEISFPGIESALRSPCIVAPARFPNGHEPRRSNGHEPRRSRISFTALWDTGATISMISKKVISACRLRIEGYAPEVQHVGGVDKNVPIFYIKLSLREDIEFPSVQVLRGNLIDFDVLIGMDIISKGDFSILNNGGSTDFSFRLPSVAGDNLEIARDGNNPKQGERDRSGKRKERNRERR